MILKKLAAKSEGEAICYLCSVPLIEYIEAIQDDYQQYSVQRGIVNNRYLDRLVDTVHSKGHIPPIVLVTDTIEENGSRITVPNFSVLDGLQRTHRLKVIYDSIEFLQDSNIEEFEGNIAKFCRTHSSQIREIGANTKLISTLVNYNAHNLKSVSEFFSDNDIWLEVWVGLDNSQQINKMLLLNAGHKSVNIKHQLELLFLDKLIDLEKLAGKDVKFMREREVSAIQYSKRREKDQFHFSHIISAIISLSAGKIVQTNADFISSLQTDSNDIELSEGFGYEQLRLVIDFLVSLDDALFNQYGTTGVKWLGREVVLVGLFGAIGAYAAKNQEDIQRVLMRLIKNIGAFSQHLKLDSFETSRNRVELNKVNVGLVNKKAVFQAVTDYLVNNQTATWSDYFGIVAK